MQTVPGKLIRTLALSSVIVLLGNPVADWLGLKYWLPGIRGTSSRIFAYASAGEPADLLVLGSSLSVQGVIPRVIEDEYHRATGESMTTYNLAMAGNGISTAAIVFRDMVDACGCPRAVLLELSPRTLDQTSESVRRALEYHSSLVDTAAGVPFIRTTEWFDAAGWGLLRGFLNVVLWASHPPRSEVWQSILAHWVESRGSAYAYPNPERPPQDISDWSPKERARQLRKSPIGKRPETAPDLAFGGFPMRSFEAALALAGDCNSRVLVWTSPSTPEYAALFRPQETARFEAVLAELAGREGVEVFDAGDGRLALDDVDFVDFTHLNSRGAVKLSKALAHRLSRQ